MHTWIKSTKNIAASIEYPIKEKRIKNNNEVRVAGICCGGGLIDTGDKQTITDQFLRVLELGDRRRKRLNNDYPIQGYKRTLSFSRNEIDPEDPVWVDKALDITRDVMYNLAGQDNQWIAVTQKDGKAGLIHVHVIQSALHQNTLKALAGRETSYRHFRDQTESKMRAHGIIPDSGKDHSKRKQSEAIKRQNHAKDEEEYSWMQDLEHRIRQAAACAANADEFELELKKKGVLISRKTKSGWTFVLANSSHEKYIGKKARYDRFSEDFSMPALNRIFDENYKSRNEVNIVKKASDAYEMKRNEKSGEFYAESGFSSPEQKNGHKNGIFDTDTSRRVPKISNENFAAGEMIER